MGCRFKLGQKIVAVVDHSQGDFKKDDEFEVLEIDSDCQGYVIKIREGNTPSVIYCKHGNPHFFHGRFYLERCFEPIQEVQRGEMTFEEALKMTKTKKLVPSD